MSAVGQVEQVEDDPLVNQPAFWMSIVVSVVATVVAGLAIGLLDASGVRLLFVTGSLAIGLAVWTANRALIGIGTLCWIGATIIVSKDMATSEALSMNAAVVVTVVAIILASDVSFLLRRGSVVSPRTMTGMTAITVGALALGVLPALVVIFVAVDVTWPEWLVATPIVGLVLLAILLILAARSRSKAKKRELEQPPPPSGRPVQYVPQRSTRGAPPPQGKPVSMPSPPQPGTMTAATVTIDGVDIDYVTITPADFSIGDTAPVLLAMPPGDQTLDLTLGMISGTYATQALARGWVVVSPAAPDGELYFNGSETLIPTLIDWIGSWVDIEGGRPHLAGISNGGISSFRLAANQPDAFASMIVFPGFPRSDADQAALEQLADLPVRMFVGETDTGWIPRMEETFAALVALGSDVALDIRATESIRTWFLTNSNVLSSLLDTLR